MKFEIDPNELTIDQRAHVAAFITGWPAYSEVANRLKEILDALETEEFKMAKRAGGIAGARNISEEQRLFDDSIAAVKYDPVTNTATPITNEEFYITEEQRLDAEQKSELADIPEVNLNAIFGTPNIAEEMTQLIEDRKALVSDIMHNTVPLDKEGLPWDSRIHSSSKATIADGSWKLRRGVDPTEVEKVKAQLKELMAVPKFTDLTSELLNVAFNTPNADNEVAQALVDAARVPVPPAPVIVGMDLAAGTDTSVITQIPPAPKSHYLIDQDPTVAANQQPTPVTLTDLIGRMSKAIAEGRLSQANVTEICVKYGVSEFHLLSNRPDLLPLIDADMKAMGV